MVSCAVRSCCSRDGVNKKKLSGITFHRFPKDPERLEAWINFTNRGDWKPTKYSVLCSKHFLEKDFDRTSKNLVRLRKEAVPMLLRGKSTLIHSRMNNNDEPNEPVASISSSVHADPVIEIPGLLNQMSSREKNLLERLRKVQKISALRKRKLVSLQRKLCRRERKLSNMKNIIADLGKKKLMEEENLLLIQQLGGPQELYLRQYKKNKGKSVPRKYSKELKVFALTLHYYSPAAYKYVRRTFNTCLPHTQTISQWYKSVNGLPGFTSEALNALHMKCSNSEERIICALVMDEMAIRQHEEWVPSQNRAYGYVDMGTGLKETTIAKEALVFLLNCVNGNWKIPIGYFLIAGISSEQKKGLVSECLRKCHGAGVKVVSLTFDGTPTNITMANKLGCRLNHHNLKSNFKYPSCADEVAILLDPSHMIKLVRNTLGDKLSFIDRDTNYVEWRYFKELNALQESETFHLANKLRGQHIQYKKQKMKVRLATQLFSESVATAFQFCKDILKLSAFENVGATVKFTRLMNNLFDVLNSRNLMQMGFKKPISRRNYSYIEEFLNDSDNYIGNLRTHFSGPLLLDTEQHTGFLGLKVCISSVKFLYKNLIEEKEELKFLPVYKLSQDNLELFFCSIRSHGGHNNNPTARQFQSAYKKMLVHVEVKESFRGNCIPLEELSILKCDAIQHINITSNEYRANSVYDESFQNSIEMNHDYLHDPQSEFSKYIITYIAGYIVHYLKKKIICTRCLEALMSDTRDSFLYSFVDLKNKKGLQFPSKDVIEICLKCEKVLKREIIIAGPNCVSITTLNNKMFKEFVSSNIFSSLIDHSFDQFFLDNHRMLLIKSIINSYSNIRMISLCKSKVDKSSSIRHQSNKTVLFKGQ